MAGPSRASCERGGAARTSYPVASLDFTIHRSVFSLFSTSSLALSLALLGSRASCTAWVLPDENETDFCLVRAAASCDLITRVFQPKIFPLLRVSWSRGRRHFCLFVLGVAVVAAMREMQGLDMQGVKALCLHSSSPTIPLPTFVG